MKRSRMVGDTEPPKFNVYNGFCRKDARTRRIESKGEFSAHPSPIKLTSGAKKIFAKAGTEAKTNIAEVVRQAFYHNCRAATTVKRWTVDSNLRVEVLS